MGTVAPLLENQPTMCNRCGSHYLWVSRPPKAVLWTLVKKTTYPSHQKDSPELGS